MANYAIFPERIKTTAQDGVLVEAGNVSVSMGSGVTTNLQTKITSLGSAVTELDSTVSNLKVKDASVSTDGQTLTINKTDGDITFAGGSSYKYYKESSGTSGSILIGTTNAGGPQTVNLKAGLTSGSYPYNGALSLGTTSIQQRVSMGSDIASLSICTDGLNYLLESGDAVVSSLSMGTEMVCRIGTKVSLSMGNYGLNYSASLGTVVESKPLIYDISTAVDGLVLHYTDGTTKNITISSQGGSIVIE